MFKKFLKMKFSISGTFSGFLFVLILPNIALASDLSLIPVFTAYNSLLNKVKTEVSGSIHNYYDSYTSNLASIIYSQEPTTLTPVPKKVALVTPVVKENTKKSAPTVKGELAKPEGVKYIYIPIPGPKGDKGDKGDPGITTFSTVSSPAPVSYIPVGITIPNPNVNFSGGAYATIGNLTSNIFTNTTSNITNLNVTTENVSGNSTILGNISVGGTSSLTGNTTIAGTLGVTGNTTFAGNINVTGTITGNVVGTLNPNLTTGSVYFQGTNAVGEDNANFFYNPTTHRLGLGTNAPGATLDVNGIAQFANGQYIQSSSGGTANSIQLNDSNGVMLLRGVGHSIGFRVSNTGANDVTINNSGNLGVGTTSPGSKLVVSSVGNSTNPTVRTMDNNGTLGAVSTIEYTAATLNNKIWFNRVTGSGYGIGKMNDDLSGATDYLNIDNTGVPTFQSSTIKVNGGSSTDVWTYYQQNGSLRAAVGYRNSSGALTLYDGANDALVVKSGNVGIGTTAPGAPLHVASASGTSSSGVEILRLAPTYGGVGSGGFINFTNNTDNTVLSQIRSITAASSVIDMSFSTYNSSLTEKMRITAGGNVGIGTTAPAYLLQVAGSGSTANGFSSAVFGSPEGSSNAGNLYGIGVSKYGTELFSFGINKNSTTGVVPANSPYISTYGLGSSISIGRGLNGLPSTSDIFIQGTTGNVGIGTTTPTAGYKLDVTGSVNVSNNLAVGSIVNASGFSASGSGYYEWGSRSMLKSPSDGIISLLNQAQTGFTRLNFGGTTSAFPALVVNGSDLQVIRSDGSTNANLLVTGNVGIGTTNPQATLDVAGLVTIQANSGIGFNLYYNGGWKYKDNGYANAIYQTNGSGGLNFTTFSSNGSGNGAPGSENVRMSILNNGNVGIGTTTPSAILHTYVSTGNNILKIENLSNAAATEIDFTNNNVLRSSINLASSGAELVFRNAGTAGRNAGFEFYNDALSSSVPVLKLLNNGNVGIGTTTPGAKLDVAGAALFGSNTFTKSTLATGNLALDNGSTDTPGIHFYTAANTNWGIDNNNGQFRFVNNLDESGGAVRAILENNGRFTLSYSGDSYIRLTDTATNGGSFDVVSNVVGTTPTFNISNTSSNLFSIQTGGNVGIGTTTPGQKLEINGALKLNNTGGSFDSIYANSVGFVSIQRSNGDVFFSNGTTGTLNLIGGNVGIGTTAPSAKLEITGPSSSPNNALFVTTNSWTSLSSGSAVRIGTGATSGNTYGVIDVLQTGGSGVGNLAIAPIGGNVGIGTSTPGAPLEVKGTGTGATIAKFTDVNTTGCTLATGGTISCSSDIRLKKNIEDINYGLDTLMQLHPVLYNWNYENDGQTKSLGFIAQEVESIIPKLVSTDENGMKSLNTTGIIPILTKSVQDLNLKINDITNINDLTKQNSLRDSIVAWLSNATNGIGDMFANRVRTKEICVSDTSGETCITKSQLDLLISSANNAGIINNVSTPANPTTPPTPEENNSITTENNSTPVENNSTDSNPPSTP